MSRLSIDISPEQHKQIKALAALEGKSIKTLILEKIFEQDTANEDEMGAWEDLKAFLLERIHKAEKSEPVKKSFQQITEDVITSRKS